jgi:hypothetical protein
LIHPQLRCDIYIYMSICKISVLSLPVCCTIVLGRWSWCLIYIYCICISI